MSLRRSPPALLLLLAFCPLGVTAACTALKKYEILSFFFDGVPDPRTPGTPDFIGPVPRIELRSLTLEERAKLQEERLKKVEVFFHKPFQEKRCGDCHSTAPRGGNSQPTWRQGLSELRLPKKLLCKKCHKPPEEAFVHGPVAAGECAQCHEHHRSSYPHLLKVKNPDTLCARCHTGDTFVTRKRHKTFEKGSCTECHDPHSSKRRYMIKATVVPGLGKESRGKTRKSMETRPPKWRPGEGGGHR